MNKFNAVFSFILIMFIFLLALGCRQEAPPPSTVPYPGPSPSSGTTEVTMYTNSEYSFSFNFCSREFEVAENFKGVNVALLGPFLWDYEHRINIIVMINEFPKDKSLDDFIKDNIESGKKVLKDYATVDDYTATIGDLPARAVVFTFQQEVGEETAEYKDIFIAFIKDNMVYMIKYDVPTEFHEEYKNCFDIVISSISFSQ